MPNRNRRIMSVVVLLLTISLTLAACRSPEPGGPEAQRQGGAPAIPEAIAQGERAEPSLVVYMHETSETQTMAFEEYLAGVVAAEMEPAWDMEALKAQAIMARTFTLDKIARQGGVPDRNAHASTNIEEFQAYNAERVDDNVRQAVEATRGMILGFEGEFVRTWFHAYCDGQTSSAQAGLAFDQFPTPFIASVEDICPEAAPEDVRDFTVTFTRQQMLTAMEQIGQAPGDFTEVEVVEQDDAGRAVKVKIGQATISAPALRIALGSTELRSTKWSDVTVEGNNITFTGSGYGHGVGLCQWGAKARAERGDNYEAIVKAYFPTSEIHQLWD